MAIGSIIAQQAMINAQIDACNAEIRVLGEKIERLLEAQIKLKKSQRCIEDINNNLEKLASEQERWEGDNFNKHKERTKDEVINPVRMYLNELNNVLDDIEKKISQLREEITALQERIKSLNAMKANLVG